MQNNKFSEELIFTEVLKYAPHLEQKFAVGCSGGVDSISLCFALQKSGFTNFVAIICNHGIRQNSGAEARQVCAYLQANGIEAIVLDLENFTKTKNLENNARLARQKAMFAYCKSLGVKTLLLAHNKNDVIETFFMRLERGTGLTGLCSIEPNTQFCFMKNGSLNLINIVRPFIDVAKQDIINFASSHKLQIWQDETNEDTKIRRNFVRSVLQAQKCELEIIQNLSTTIANLQSEKNFIESFAIEHFKACVSFENNQNTYLSEKCLIPFNLCNKINLNVEYYKALPYNIRRFILVQIISILQFFSKFEQKFEEGNDVIIFNTSNIRESSIKNLDCFLCLQNNKPFYSLQNITAKFVEKFICSFNINKTVDVGM
jgi:tRNA(Ile)-lysidine synthetase-like protein